MWITDGPQNLFTNLAIPLIFAKFLIISTLQALTRTHGIVLLVYRTYGIVLDLGQCTLEDDSHHSLFLEASQGGVNLGYCTVKAAGEGLGIENRPHPPGNILRQGFDDPDIVESLHKAGIIDIEGLENWP